MISGFRFWLVLVLVAATSALVYRRSDLDLQVPREPVAQLPSAIGPWTGVDRPIDARVLDVLGNGDFLSRLYSAHDGKPPVDLFIGYFPTQRSGSSIHSPKNCLPGAGWYFESSHADTVIASNGLPFRVGEYVISNGAAKQFVIYWYQAHGRSIASEYWAKFYLISDAIRMNRTDGALVRVITPVMANEGTEPARERARAFSAVVAPHLHRYIPD